ncbi:MAG: sigma-70 family RNA polymerase sigma factor [Planctomycetes bacterium]|nr:sigma-70 family RNA polymerase sigma factor [Planctomycetota bacterium]
MVGTRQTDDLAALYAALKGPLCTVALHGTRERTAAEDVVHDVFARLCREPHRHAFPSLDDARRFLARAVFCRVLELRRRRRPEPAPDQAIERAAAAEVEPLDRLVAHDEATRLRAELARLPVPQAEVVVLHLHGGLKFREIAELLSIPIDTATTRYRTALQKLSSRLRAARVEE